MEDVNVLIKKIVRRKKSNGEDYLVVKYKNNNTGETSSSGGTDLKTALAFYENVIERLKKMAADKDLGVEVTMRLKNGNEGYPPTIIKIISLSDRLWGDNADAGETVFEAC
ncbi:hypothetical protein ACHWQZ_G001168 [Mnemiopsis leidyi]